MKQICHFTKWLYVAFGGQELAYLGMKMSWSDAFKKIYFS